ncbi:hypothetical protein EV421DRAFT_1745139 [Armillaria borealis]|uniref:Uncharacterized protein n=1 Tax=Armillaria borealis TaxID=47425 RepID=A0AA39IU54_9AGAR|nr:hypothetical protein EV421DRAFT_1745139 [Armillaria borealis]
MNLHIPRTNPASLLFSHRVYREVFPRQSVDDSRSGGGLILEYRSAENQVLKYIYIHNNPAAMEPPVVPRPFGSTCDSEALANVQSHHDPWTPPLLSETALYRVFPFTPALRIQVWKPNVSQPPLRLYGLDIVDEDGNPQHVGGDAKVVSGTRGFPWPETEGEIVVALNDNGLPPQSPERFRIYGDVPYDFYYQGRFVRSYTFPFDLLYPSSSHVEEV